MSASPILIDGRSGEGGGQILRSALALSLITRAPFTIEHIRGGRAKPGLMRQHLTAVRAAAELGRADVEGDHLHSMRLHFAPSDDLSVGDFTHDIGSAGSVNLVLQTILPAALHAGGPTHWTLRGGTHNPYSPPWPFLERAFLPLLGRMGCPVKASLEQAGFYPRGGGELRVHIQPRALEPLHLHDPLEPERVRLRATAFLAGGLPRHIGRRELRALERHLPLPLDASDVETLESPGPGNALIVEAESPQLTAVFTGFGAKGVRAEVVAERLASEVTRYLEIGAPVDEHLADQLLLPMLLAGSGSFLTGPPTPHTTTNIETIQRFVPAAITIEPLDGGRHRINLQRSAPLSPD